MATLQNAVQPHRGDSTVVAQDHGQIHIKRSQQRMLAALGVTVPESKPPGSYAVALGRPQVTLPPGFVPPNFANVPQPPAWNPPSGNAAPHQFNSPSNFPRPYIPAAPMPFVPQGRGMPRGGAAGGTHR